MSAAVLRVGCPTLPHVPAPPKQGYPQKNTQLGYMINLVQQLHSKRLNVTKEVEYERRRKRKKKQQRAEATVRDITCPEPVLGG